MPVTYQRQYLLSKYILKKSDIVQESNIIDEHKMFTDINNSNMISRFYVSFTTDIKKSHCHCYASVEDHSYTNINHMLSVVSEKRGHCHVG